MFLIFCRVISSLILDQFLSLLCLGQLYLLLSLEVVSIYWERLEKLRKKSKVVVEVLKSLLVSHAPGPSF